jgi:ketosteroid isomerase-like protein
MRHAILLTLFALAALPCEGQRADSATIARQLDSVYARMTLGYQRTDARMVTSLYDDRAFYLPPGAPILRGRDAISREFTKILGNRPADSSSGAGITFEIVDRAIAGDIAFDIGLFRFGSTTPAGKFIVLWRRGSDGRWRMWADQYNEYRAAQTTVPTSLPAPAATSPLGKLDDLAGAYRAVYPSAFESNEIRVRLEAGRLTMHGMSAEPAVLAPSAKADEFRVIDPSGPEGLVMRFHRSGGRVVSAALGNNSASAPGPTFFFLRQ